MIDNQRQFVRCVHEEQEWLNELVAPTRFIPTTVRVDDHDLDVVLAWEGHQQSGSFLIRAASIGVYDGDSEQAIVCASGGNFGAAMACAAGQEGKGRRKAVVFVPKRTPTAKRVNIGRYQPHELHIVDGSFCDAEQAARDYARDHRAQFVSGYDGEIAMLGAGTLAAEIAAEVPDVTELLVPTGGGGLLAGVAEYFGNGAVRVVAVETRQSGSMAAAVKKGRRVLADTRGLAASSLGVPIVGADGLEAMRRWRLRGASVFDEDAVTAHQWLWDHHGLPAEIGAAAPLAALTEQRYKPRAHGRVVVVVTGSNLDPGYLKKD